MKFQTKLNAIIDIARQRGCPPTVMVQHAHKRITWAGGKRLSGRLSATTFAISDITQWVSAVSSMKFAKLGPAPATTKGLPIGSPGSKAGCSVVLAHDESAWSLGHDIRVCHGYARGEWETQVAWCRYVDDVLMTRRWCCHDCLQHAIKCYTAIPFDIATNSAQHMPAQWIDLSVDFQNGVLSLDWAPRSLATAWLGQYSGPA